MKTICLEKVALSMQIAKTKGADKDLLESDLKFRLRKMQFPGFPSGYIRLN